jgi:hypothetical protein
LQIGFHRINNSVSRFYLLLLVEFQVLKADSMKMTVFSVVEPCSLVETDRRFRGAYCFHHQGVDQFPSDYTAQHPRRQGFISSVSFEFSNTGLLSTFGKFAMRKT